MADIFISYTSSDRDWAFWIAHELERLGHKPRVHEWEISAGGDIMAWMEERHHAANHILCVVSKAYLEAPYSSMERRAAQWAAASKRPGFALPIFVEECEASTLFATLKRCDLHGLSQEDARAALKKFLTPVGKPSGRLSFPGGALSDSTKDSARLTTLFPGKVAPLNAQVALSNIPISVPRHFVGRDEALAAIERTLAGGDGRAAITALHGLRGVGKTVLAVAYAERHRGDYRATWWVRAQTEPTMRADLVGLGVRLGWIAADEKEEPALGAVLERLRHDGDGILLIYDNAIDADGIRLYLPRSGAARVLITSNAHALRSIAELVEIEVWPKQIGADYLIARTGRTAERAAAVALSEALGGLPLAHEQAGAYCERLEVPLAEYQRRFGAAPARLLDDARDAPREYHDRTTVAKTFALAIDEASKRHPAAEQLITHAALLAPEPIPLFLFADARQTFGEPLASALSDDGLDEAVAALRAFALVDRESIVDERNPAITTDCIRLHRLVGQLAVARSGSETPQVGRCSLIDAVATAYPNGVFHDPATWPRARRLDALALALVGSDASVPPGSELATCYLLNQLAGYRHHALAAYGEARPLFERALALYEVFLGSEHPETALSLNNLGGLLGDQGDLVGARLLFERALTIREKLLGSEHSDTAISRNNLADIRSQQGDLSEARQLLERALAIHEKVHGSDHLGTAATLNNLANLFLDQGDLEGAQPLFERALTICEKALGHDHLHTNVVRGNLARFYLQQGRSTDALSLAEAALTAHDKTLGREHHITKISADINADVLEALGCRAEATALRQRYGIGSGGKPT